MSRPSLISFLIFRRGLFLVFFALSIIVIDSLLLGTRDQQGAFLGACVGISDAGAQQGPARPRSGSRPRRRSVGPGGAALPIDDSAPLNTLLPNVGFNPPAEPTPAPPRPVRGGQNGRQQPVVTRVPVVRSSTPLTPVASSTDAPTQLPPGTSSGLLQAPGADGPVVQSSEDEGGHVLDVQDQEGPNGRQHQVMEFGDIRVTGLGGGRRDGFEIALRDPSYCGPDASDPHCSCVDRYNARNRLIWDRFQNSYGRMFRPAVGTSTTTNTTVSDPIRSIYSYSGSPLSGGSMVTSVSRESVQRELIQSQVDYNRCLNPCLSEGDARFLYQLIQRESDLVNAEASRRTPGARALAEPSHEVTPELIQCQRVVNQYVCFDSNSEADVACRARLVTCMDNQECRDNLSSCRQNIGVFNQQTYDYDSQYSRYMAQLDPEIQRIGDQLMIYRQERDDATLNHQAVLRTNVDSNYRTAVANIQNELERAVVDGIRTHQYTASVWVPTAGQSGNGLTRDGLVDPEACQNMVATKEFPAFYGLDLAFVIDNSLSMNEEPAAIVRSGTEGSRGSVDEGVMSVSRQLVTRTLPDVLAMTQESRRFPPRIFLTTQNLTDSPDMSLFIDTSDASVDWRSRATQFLDHIFSSDSSVPHDNQERSLMVIKDRIFRETGRFPRASANLLLGVITDEPDNSFIDLSTDARIDAISHLAEGIQSFVQGQVSFFSTRTSDDYDQNMSTFATALDRGVSLHGPHFIGLGEPQVFHDGIMSKIREFVQPSLTGVRRVNLDPPLEFALSLSLVREGQEPLNIPSVAPVAQAGTAGSAGFDCRGHLPGAASGTPAMERGCWGVVNGRGDQFFLSNGVLSPQESNSTKFVLTYLKHMPDNLITMMIRAPLRLPQPPRPPVAAQQQGSTGAGSPPSRGAVDDLVDRYGAPVTPVVTPPRARPQQRRRR